jgi:hypothetical protein
MKGLIVIIYIHTLKNDFLVVHGGGIEPPNALSDEIAQANYFFSQNSFLM